MTKQRIALAVIALLAIAVVTAQRDAPADVPPAPAAVDRFARPGEWSTYRPAAHLTPATRWMNDPQRPFYLDGRWHFYYLYNADHPHGNGTAWYHATSTDLVHWEDEGVAIDKYRNGLGDIWSGSAVVDERGTAGFGAGAVIALVTQQVDGVQRQSLFYSTDGGYSFENHEGNPVMDNPGVEAWRDPKVVWDDKRSQWLMLLAEGDKVGFYTSPDLRTWTYRSGFARDDLGVLECPDLFELPVDGDPTRTTWVLGVSANGERTGRTTGYAYWTGDWNGESFTPDRPDPRWLDSGSDFYAAVTWPGRHGGRYAIGWMNNWAYAGELPTEDWSGGMMSTVRELTLRPRADGLALASRPIGALASLEGDPARVSDLRVDTEHTAIPQPISDAYRMRVRLSASPDDPAREARIRIHGADGTSAAVGYDFERGSVFLTRDGDAVAGTMPEEYREVRTAQAAPRAGVVDLDVIVDRGSIEVFAQDGEAVLSNLTFLAPGRLSVEPVDGAVDLHEFSVAPLAVAAPQRR
ncbi:2,6-beta-fructan 6-levanbiohydrolase [Actinokineospora soli]